MADALPDYGRVRGASFRLIGNIGRFRSPLTQTEQAVARPGSHWEATYTLELKAADGLSAGEWMAVLNKAVAEATLLYINDPYRTLPLLFAEASLGLSCDTTAVTCDKTADTSDEGHPWGAPQVNGASQTGSSLVTDGWPASTNLFKPGDYLAFDNGTFRELHQVAAVAASDASGAVTLSITPPIHRSPADNALILIDGRRVGAAALLAAEMRIDPPSVRFTGQLPRLVSIEFTAREALR